MTTIPYPKFEEKAQKEDANVHAARYPQYGRVLEDFQEGEVFCHPRGVTIHPAFAIEFATTFMECNPLYTNTEYAKAHGYKGLIASPLMVMNIVLSLGVQNDSEKAIANLGYYDMCFVKPVYAGDTLRAYTKVLERKVKEGKPGIVTIRTIGVNQKDELVLQYDRKIMVPGQSPGTLEAPKGRGVAEDKYFPEMSEPTIGLPDPKASYPRDLTGTQTYFDNFKVGDIIVHANGRTITDEHYAWTYRVMNTHPLHYDRLYSTGRSGAMSGEPIVYGGLVFGWLAGYTEGYHTQPAVSGDTVYAISRVLDKEEGPDGYDAGIVTFQLIGLKNMRPKEAIEKYGADLFMKENSKKKQGKEKISEKIFEIERRVLIKK
jgi:2-methylfumaryl-CoA hydratase